MQIPYPLKHAMLAASGLALAQETGLDCVTSRCFRLGSTIFLTPELPDFSYYNRSI